MKIIIDIDTLTDNVTSISASSSDANFPVTNLRDNFTTNLWKAASGTSATITLLVSKGSAIELLNTNATSVVVSAGSGETYEDETDWSLEDGYSYADDEVVVVTAYSLPGEKGRLWGEYPEFTGPHIVTVALTAGGVPSAGIIRAGVVERFRNPAPSHEESSIDYSIEKELNNGADYFRKRNVVRTFDNLTMLETRANAWKFKHSIFDAVGPQPLAIRLMDGSTVTDHEFVIFAKRIEPPQIEHVTNTKSQISFSLKEVI